MDDEAKLRQDYGATAALVECDDEATWEDGIEPELELPLGELPSIIVDWDRAA